MKILELLLPKNLKDKDLSPKTAKKIDNLQQRMNKYVDKISDPTTSKQGKDFLKAKLKSDYEELKDIIEDTINEHIVKHGGGYRLLSKKGKNLGDFKSKKAAGKHEGEVEWFKAHPKESVELPPVEPIAPLPTYEVVDSRTGKVMGKPYTSKSRARARADKLDNDYGAYRYKVRKVGSDFMIENQLNEAVHRLPLTDGDFEIVKQVMSHPIPAVIAPIYLQEILDDDEFSAMLQEWEETSPAMDVRPHVVEWFKRVMPDQMHRFLNNEQTMKQKMGLQSVIHGYEPDDYHGASEESSGNAYGRY